MIHRAITHPTRKLLSLLTLFALLVIAAQAAAQGPAPANPFEVPPLAPEWEGAPPGRRLSTGAAHGADGPVIAVSPDGSKMMVVYNYRVTGSTNRDPYATVFDGQNWSTPTPVLISAGSDSAQPALTYSANNVAHVVWEEPDIGLGYMRNDGSGWSGLNFITPTAAGERLFGISISATGNQTLDVVWAAKPDVTRNPNIYHSRSTNGGNAWSTPVVIADTAPTSQAPKIGHDASGRPHVVWQETTATPGFEIRYSRGLPWSAPIAISTGIDSARRPALTIAGNTLHVSYTRSVAVDSDNINQWAYYTRCVAGNCSVPANWSAAVNVSGQPVRVNESAPFDLIPSIASHDGCTYIFFHGYVENVSPNEVVWNVNSCDGWSAGGRDQVTGFNMRGIYPQAVMVGDRIHMVYEWVSGANHQIYYMRGSLPEDGGGGPDPDPDPGPAGPDGAYLPFIARP